MSDVERWTVVVTSDGSVTIPGEVRGKLYIEVPGRIQFVENEQGEVVVKAVKRPSEHRGTLASGSEDDEKPATELLRDERAQEET